jgi:hypothetical protein
MTRGSLWYSETLFTIYQGGKHAVLSIHDLIEIEVFENIMSVTSYFLVFDCCWSSLACGEWPTSVPFVYN